MGKKHADEMLFWTRQEFQTFIEVMKDRPASYAVFMTLYFTGIREGELLALTPSDIDFEKKALTVNKSYQRLGKEDIITTRQREPFSKHICLENQRISTDFCEKSARLS